MMPHKVLQKSSSFSSQIVTRIHNSVRRGGLYSVCRNVYPSSLKSTGSHVAAVYRMCVTSRCARKVHMSKSLDGVGESNTKFLWKSLASFSDQKITQKDRVRTQPFSVFCNGEERAEFVCPQFCRKCHAHISDDFVLRQSSNFEKDVHRDCVLSVLRQPDGVHLRIFIIVIGRVIITHLLVARHCGYSWQETFSNKPYSYGHKMEICSKQWAPMLRAWSLRLHKHVAPSLCLCLGAVGSTNTSTLTWYNSQHTLNVLILQCVHLLPQK